MEDSTIADSDFRDDDGDDDQGQFDIEGLRSHGDLDNSLDDTQGCEHLEPSSEDEGDLDLETLSQDDHPCLAKGYFSIFNSQEVRPLHRKRDFEYTLDIDGFIVLSKYLSTFNVCDYGEARLYNYAAYPRDVINIYQDVNRSQLFDPLPSHLANYDRWLPAFRLMNIGLHVVFRPTVDATLMNLRSQRDQQSGLKKQWWMSVLLPAMNSLPDDCLTRLRNATQTIQSTQIVPDYLRVYKEDLHLLDRALQEVSSPSDLEWYFIHWRYGQRMELEEGEDLGPNSFRLGDMFDLSTATKFSIHLALSFSCKDKRYSLFWNLNRTSGWMSGRSKQVYPLFGLSELGNVVVENPNPKNSVIQATVKERVTFIQHYTPFVKGMKDKAPLELRPHLLTYLLGKEYVRVRAKFRKVWDEVSTKRTLHELLELIHPTVPFDARLELVMTGDDASFLSTFDHHSLAQAVLSDRLLIMVPAHPLANYVQNLFKELYEPLGASIDGIMSGPGTLGTILLCETLINFLCTGSRQNLPYNLLKAYKILPLATLSCTKRIDLRPYATLQNGVLYLTRPKVERVWVPLRPLPVSARATATVMLQFLDQLKARPHTVQAFTKAADIIVGQFKHDLVEMGVVSMRQFEGIVDDGCIRDIMPANEYVTRVLSVPANLPSEMSTKTFLATAMDLLPHKELKDKITEKLLQQAKMVPHTTVHARTITFSSLVCTLLTRGHVYPRLLSEEDAHRLVMATSPLLRDHFSLGKKGMMMVQRRRPRLTRCVRNAVAKARFGARGTSTRSILAVVCFAVMALARKEKLFKYKTKIKFARLYRATNLSRHLKWKEMERIVLMSSFDIRECSIVLDRI